MTTEELTEKFNEFNSRFFQNAIEGYTVVSWKHLKSRTGLCNYAKKLIQVDGTLGEKEACGVLLHEMVHAQIGFAHGHDKVFNAECERIEALTGYNLRQYRQTAEQKEADEEKYYNYLMRLATDPRRHREKVQEEAAFARKHRLISADKYKAILAKNNQ